MINIVYPLIRSEWSKEILYSLRSIDKHLKTDYKVIIYSNYCPKWLNVDSVELIDHQIQPTPVGLNPPQYNQGLIYKRLINRGDLDKFVYFNDDIYLLQDVDNLSDIYIRDSSLNIRRPNNNKWNQLLYKTRMSLKQRGFTYYNYETHLPYEFEVDKLAKLPKVLTGERLLATTYYNTYNVGIRPHCNTVKIGCYSSAVLAEYDYKFNSGKYTWFNHDDSCIDVAKQILPSLFNTKSKFEC